MTITVTLTQILTFTLTYICPYPISPNKPLNYSHTIPLLTVPILTGHLSAPRKLYCHAACHFASAAYTLCIHYIIYDVIMFSVSPANRTLSAAMYIDGSATSSSLSPADFHACYGFNCRLLTPSTRPNSVHQLYAAAERNPCPSIAACDRFRDDGLSGVNIFSPCLTLQSLSTSGGSDDVDSYCGGDEVYFSQILIVL